VGGKRVGYLAIEEKEVHAPVLERALELLQEQLDAMDKAEAAAAGEWRERENDE
jgi:hypothetical protein